MRKIYPGANGFIDDLLNSESGGGGGGGTGGGTGGDTQTGPKPSGLPREGADISSETPTAG